MVTLKGICLHKFGRAVHGNRNVCCLNVQRVIVGCSEFISGIHTTLSIMGCDNLWGATQNYILMCIRTDGRMHRRKNNLKAICPLSFFKVGCISKGQGYIYL